MEHSLSNSLFRHGDFAYVHSGNGSLILDSEFCVVSGDLNCMLFANRPS